MSIEFKDGHPAFGVAVFSRWQGTSHRLFGSALRVNSGISLHIKQARTGWDLSREWIHGGKEIVEIHMTETQFAQLLTTMNMGDGVPVTIAYVRDVGLIRMPETAYESEPERIQKDFKNQQKEMANKLDAMTAGIKAILAKPSIGKKDREDIQSLVDAFSNHARHTLPFLISQLQEAAEKVVTQAKTELTAFADRTLKAAGLEHLKDKAPKAIGFEE